VLEGPLTIDPGDSIEPPATDGVPLPVPIIRAEC
jgi:hypothetical protein